MFTYPITDPKPLNDIPITLKQMQARVTEECKPRLAIVLFGLEPGWIIRFSDNSGQFALSQSDGVITRIYRAAKPMKEPLKALGYTSIDIPVTCERLEIHNAFIDERLSWIQKQMRKRQLTNQKLGDEIGVHNGIISMVINGLMDNHLVENTLCVHLDISREELFPKIPDHILSDD